MHIFSQDHGRWNAEAVQSMKGTPWDDIPGREGIDIKSHIYMPEATKPFVLEERIEEGKQTRRVRITSSYLIASGMTPGMPGMHCLEPRLHRTNAHSIMQKAHAVQDEGIQCHNTDQIR